MSIRLIWEAAGGPASDPAFRIVFCCDVCGEPIDDLTAANHLYDTRTREGMPRVFVVHRVACLTTLVETMERNGGRPGWLDLELLPGQLLNSTAVGAEYETVLTRRRKVAPEAIDPRPPDAPSPDIAQA